MKYREHLVRVAIGRLGSRAAAEDKVQAVLLNLLRQGAELDDDIGLHYLEVATLHECDRRDGWEARRVAGGDALLADLAASAEPEEALMFRRLELDEVLRFREELPEKERLVIEYIYLDGLSYPETAEAMGIDIGTVRTHRTRAFAKLRKRFAEPDDA